MEGNCSYKDNDSSDKGKIMIKIILVTMITITI